MSAPINESRPARTLALFFNILAGLALMALMIITCIDVFGRYLLNQPLTGSTELIELGLGLIVFAALPVLGWRGENVVVDILDKYFSAKAHMIRSHLINIVFAITLYFVGERLLELGKRSLGYGEETEFLHIPLGWSINFMGVMCWLTAIALLTFGTLYVHKTFKKIKAQ